MRVLVYPLKLGTHRDSFDLFTLGDFHYGSNSTHEKLMYKAIDEIKENMEHRITRTVLMGDYVDCMPPGDKREDHRVQSKSDVLLAYTELRDMIEPIKDSVICCLSGNHDEDWYYHTKTDYVNWLCLELDIPVGTYESFIRFKVSCNGSASKRNLNLFAWHGAGGGRTVGSSFNKVKYPTESFRDLDIVAMAHSHRLGMVYEEYLDIDEDKLDVYEYDRYFVLTGGFLKGYIPNVSTYISKKMLPPVSLGGVKLTVKPFHEVDTRDEVKVTFNKIP